MASNNSQNSTPQSIDDVLNLLSLWAGNFHRNTTKAFADLRPKDYIRLVIIIGAYCLLRPYLMKLGAKLQARGYEREDRAAQEEAEKTRLNGNDLRGTRIALPGIESDDEEDEDEAEASSWGRKAKLRQRKMIRKKLEEQEERLRSMQEEESDQDIADLLED
ncbi:DUF1531-domain-containing protein [Rhizodiscina lignyota]|uniref:DUF1531-domain-containing protein n=1 Tax=Rhizodiscina lignyota TaxID=1504668 RepID=A0A9P4I7M2_9PEZI|nr:DUF1531-domain-containing protein [Rhizodiscina lignyota]